MLGVAVKSARIWVPRVSMEGASAFIRRPTCVSTNS